MVHATLNVPIGDYIETRFIETGLTGVVDDYHHVWEARINSVLVGPTNIDSLCSGPAHGDSGSSGFRIRRYYLGIWSTEVDCAGNGTYVVSKLLTVSYNPASALVRTEAERLSQGDGSPI